MLGKVPFENRLKYLLTFRPGLGIHTRRTACGRYDRSPNARARTFIIDRANATSWRAQKDRLLEVDSLRSVVASLQDSVTRLVSANAAAYATGYGAAYASYQDLSRRYIAELNKPRIRLPSIVGFVGAVGVGIVVGRVIR